MPWPGDYSTDSPYGPLQSRARQLGILAVVSAAYSSATDPDTGYTTGYTCLAQLMQSDGSVDLQPLNQWQIKSAFSPLGDTTIPVGTRVWLEPDPDTNAWIMLIPTFAGQGSGSGSGSGGCDDAVEPVQIECDSQGQRVVTINSLAPLVSGNTVELQVCGTTTVKIGPCSGVFGGVPTPVVTRICIITQPITFKDGDGNTVTVNSFVSASYSTSVANLPNADPAGCISIAPGSGSGSGSGDCCDNGQDCPASECTQLSAACPDGLSTQFMFTAPDGSTVTLNWICNPSDGNYSRFISTGGEWSMSYQPDAYGGWVLINLITGHVWIWPDLNGPICALTGFAMFPQDVSDPEVDMVPTNDCTISSYNCTASKCIGISGAGGTYATIELCNANCKTTYNCVAGVCTPVVGPGGTYPDLPSCQTLCEGGGDVVVSCCPNPIKKTLYAHFGGGLASLGTMTLAYNGTAWNGTATGTCGSAVGGSLACNTGTWNFSGAGGTGWPGLGSQVVVCSPFSIVGTSTATGGSCAGGFSVTINETP